jgi:hypothetical protein
MASASLDGPDPADPKTDQGLLNLPKAKKRKPSELPPSPPLQQPRPRGQWTAAWSDFLRTYPSWADHFGGEAAAYVLPKTVINKLGDHRGRKPLLSHANAQAEVAFAQLIHSAHCTVAGVWKGQPIIAPFLTDQNRVLAAEWRPEAFQPQIASTDERLIAQAGALVLDDAFRSERDALRQAWLALPSSMRSVDPLTRILQARPADPLNPSRDISPLTIAFAGGGSCMPW